ncbi:MAG: ABC transporter substrate-binding protein [Candidatus Lustribacter sp.]|jgi:ABC-type nitrate/sulfonate/bicarbonate transport system substrate-binding protein
MNRRAFALSGLAAPFATALGARAAATLTPVRIILDPTFYVHLPLLHAVDSGYFQAEGIDLQITPANGSSTLFLPMLARGEYDLGTVNPSPAFFNQFSGGFDVVLLACQTGSQPGWHDPSWLMVRQDLWDAKAIVQPSDLRGRVIDGSNSGSPIDFLLKETVRAGGLTPADVRISERLHTAADQLQALRNKAVEVSGSPEPEAGEFEAQGVAHRWVSFSTIAPWYQLEYIGASAKFAHDHPDLIHKVLRAYLRGNDDVLKSNGKWTPPLLAEAVKWSTLAPEVVRSFQGPAYPSLHGEVNLDSLTRIQQFWVSEKLVNTPVDVNKVVSLSLLRDAQRSLRF